MASVEQQQDDIEGQQSSLSRIPRIQHLDSWMIGGVFAAAISVAAYGGSKLIEKEHLKFDALQQAQRAKQEEIVQKTARANALPEIFRNAQSAHVRLPYIHGKDPMSGMILTALSQNVSAKPEVMNFTYPGRIAAAITQMDGETPEALATRYAQAFAQGSEPRDVHFFKAHPSRGTKNPYGFVIETDIPTTFLEKPYWNADRSKVTIPASSFTIALEPDVAIVVEKGRATGIVYAGNFYPFDPKVLSIYNNEEIMY